jgi:hypothetical protein
VNSDRRLNNDEKLSHIQSWLRSRSDPPIEQAGRCTEIRKTPFVPTKVRPVRLLKLSSESQVRLLECFQPPPEQISARGSFPVYTALSHRWGASQHFTTRTNTKFILEDGMSSDQLPQTFRDAIVLTRRLGYEYIWIDALCIIQDDPTDWLRESEKMGDIYTDAVCTIAVHCAADDSEGFLAKTLSKRHAIDLCMDDIDEREISICRAPNPNTDVTNSALSRRGWVLQERFMSTRTLHCTHGQVYLEDQYGITCEDNSLRSTPRMQKDLAELYQAEFLLSPSALPKLRRYFGSERSSSGLNSGDCKQTNDEFSDTSIE